MEDVEWKSFLPKRVLEDLANRVDKARAKNFKGLMGIVGQVMAEEE